VEATVCVSVSDVVRCPIRQCTVAAIQELSLVNCTFFLTSSATALGQSDFFKQTLLSIHLYSENPILSQFIGFP